MNITKEYLYDFEDKIIEIYKQGKLRSPIHLSGSIDGNLEDFLIDLFKDIKKSDWVFSTYRSHYHALLKGIPDEWLTNWILNNKSIHVMNSEYRFITSAIVSGCLPIALGVAMGIKHNSGSDHVYCFCGDMTASLGTFWDVIRYAKHNDLPITFVIEDNGLSTDTSTNEVWGCDNVNKDMLELYADKIRYVKYTRKYPHYGCGVFVDFKDVDLKQDGSF